MTSNLMSLMAALSLGLAGPAMSQDGDAAQDGDSPARVIRTTDATMTCVQMADEAARLSQDMGGDPDRSVFGMLGGVARSGAAMLVPGAGLVIAGADALTRPAADRREAEALAAQNRWFYLNGLYAGRRCHERAEATTGTPSPTATPAIAVGALGPTAAN